MSLKRIMFTGVGGQGTLTATTLVAKIAMDEGFSVTAGEIHGMAQRGGVVESAVLLGGYMSPKISPGEADILLGFEPLETLRALPYLKPGGLIVSNSEAMPPIGVSLGREKYPDMDLIRAKSEKCAGKACFIACQSLAEQAGSVLAANIVLLGALFESKSLPFDLDLLLAGIKQNLKPKIVDLNIEAAKLGANALAA